ncbi:MAG: dTMP kinase, partial [Burkholderiales bacterium]|nr:dTMP kinase [Burkholderiales bacterium]
FTDATRAYQGGGRGVDAEKIEVLARWVHPHTQPDLTVLFDLPPAAAMARLANARTLDRFESEKAEFHRRVRESYLALAARDPGRFRVIDAGLHVHEIAKLLDNILVSYCF